MPKNILNSLRKDLKQLSNKKKAAVLSRFFKTGEGEYGYGDVFLGITVPQSRAAAIKHKDMEFLDVTELLKSKIHEERLIALLILVHKFETQPMEQRRIYEFYIKNTKFVNNWDLVDLSSHKIVGGYLIDKPKDILFKLAASKNIWEKRIAMVSTYNFISNKDYKDALKIAEILVEDTDDLIQKAVGWMLKEVGNRNKDVEIKFLNKHYKKMGRTALRAALEKFPKTVAQKYLGAKA